MSLVVWYLPLGNSGLECQSQIEEVAGDMGSVPGSLHMKGTLTDELLTTSRN